ncbi:DUF4390 domain-containing protein [candidate division KSB1 bacterium]|nr:MAG: DUF4390 domain-containing protein [candidate division KSB1 bacterium]MBC6951803.1 DUF4390 domain-containing protein [candidate division KSB1 bacterium]MCE7942463.1 DUF4390 domain-containing protein [Chlorobi bacterium CHB1]MDL1876977.1 DUF4390 domain-containing protein [Cytophagia bacterium CHB2]
MGRLLHITPAVFFALAISLAAQTPRIVSLSAEPLHDSLAVKVQLEDLFPTKIANTIRSGLPTVIRFDFRLIDESGREVLRLTEAMEILYDIWAQRFRITLDDQQHFAASFEEMKKICSELERHILAAPASLRAASPYRLRLQVTVIPISSRQNHQWRERIESADLQDEAAASEAGRSGFSVNVSRLLSFFLSGKERVHGASEWATSSPFQLPAQP